MKKYIMKYYVAAEDSLESWESQSLPIGNGFFGASVFGGVQNERVQFTTNEFANIYSFGGVTSFADLYIETDCDGVIGYERGLDLNDGTAYSRFICDGGKIDRKAFCNYPDNVFVYKIKSIGKRDFIARLIVPYLGTRETKYGGRNGKVFAEERSLVLRQNLPLRNCTGELRLSVITDGQTSISDDEIKIVGAEEVVFLAVLGTNYKLSPEVFLDNCHQAIGKDPDEELKNRESAVREIGYDKLFERHKSDYGGLMNRADIDLGGKQDNRSVSELLKSLRKGNEEPYLIEIYFRYGRHLLVSSSRKGTPPSSLQGTWSAYDKSPWGSGIWHNINVQMNYWCALNTNLAETFAAYADYWKAYLKKAEEHAKDWVANFMPKKSNEDCGWIIGTAASMYEISGLGKSMHSGPGTGGLTAKMFTDYYDYTLDADFLKDYAYPAVHGCSQFMEKSVKKFGNEYLCMVSASPEQILSGVWLNEYKVQQYYATIGCAFDQQMLNVNARDDIRLSAVLGIVDDVVKREKYRIGRFSAINVGYSGQIKEYGEEKFYGEIGAARHRHISQLMALMPGNIINEDTPAWLDSANKTLDLRGDDSTGWALAYRILCRARTHDGESAFKLLKKLLCEKTYDNLWSIHPPFQIDGNFGATAGIAEMLLQSGDGKITLFPAIPNKWGTITFKNLRARGNYIVSAARSGGKIKYCRIQSQSGGKVVVSAEGIKGVTVTAKNGKLKVKYKYSANTITFDTKKGGDYKIEGFKKCERSVFVKNFSATWRRTGVLLKWRKISKKCAIYRATENDKGYKLLSVTDNSFYLDKEFFIDNKARLTYKVVVAEGEYSQKSKGSVVFLNPASELEKKRYERRLEVNNIYANEWKLR